MVVDRKLDMILFEYLTLKCLFVHDMITNNFLNRCIGNKFSLVEQRVMLCALCKLFL